MPTPPTAFIALTALVTGACVWIGSRATGRPWGVLAVVVVWLSVHAALAHFRVFYDETGMPPRMLPYLLATATCGAAVARSRLGRRILETTPIAALVALQSFRVPLEAWLYWGFLRGELPRQMTWAGWNLDVMTGLGALVVAWALVRRRPWARAALWVWNTCGALLLLTVVVVAITSAPSTLRLFTQGPALTLPFELPYTWIVSVHVWTALVCHVLIFRALRSRTSLHEDRS